MMAHQAHLASTAPRLERVDSAVIRHGLALSLVCIGALKFASNEAAAIEGLVANSPVLSWTYRTPGVWRPDPRFPFLSGAGQLLVKDLILLGAAVWTAGESLDAASARRPAR
jgi:reactive chlorine resistance protein C